MSIGSWGDIDQERFRHGANLCVRASERRGQPGTDGLQVGGDLIYGTQAR